MKLLVPTGYMISSDQGRLAIVLCPGTSPSPPATDMSGMDMAGAHAGMTDHGKSKEHGKAEMPCAFSSLAAQALGAVDPVLLIAAIAFIMVVAMRPAVLPVARHALYLRPPTRGPPVTL